MRNLLTLLAVIAACVMQAAEPSGKKPIAFLEQWRKDHPEDAYRHDIDLGYQLAKQFPEEVAKDPEWKEQIEFKAAKIEPSAGEYVKQAAGSTNRNPWAMGVAFGVLFALTSIGLRVRNWYRNKCTARMSSKTATRAVEASNNRIERRLETVPPVIPPPMLPKEYPMPIRDESDGITPKRCAISGVWSFIVIISSASLSDHPIGQFLPWPLIGLPWLFFFMNDRQRNQQTTGAAGAAGMIFGGFFIGIICAVPAVLVVWVFMKTFRFW